MAINSHLIKLQMSKLKEQNQVNIVQNNHAFGH